MAKGDHCAERVKRPLSRAPNVGDTVVVLPVLTESYLEKPVNVASVPQRSPFRYPGGKTWLVPRIRRWLAGLPEKPAEFYEPFAGGGIVSLTAAFERLAGHVTMVELDPQVAAVWHTILEEDGGAEWLAQRILCFNLTKEAVETTLAAPSLRTREQAFQTILKNRTYHGGILAPGSALVKHGENGKGLQSRWYPTTLANRIREIARFRKSITFIEGDGMEVIERNSGRAGAMWFIDPPYTASKKKAGTRLYSHHELDHNRLFDLTKKLAGDFLMTYDDAEELKDLARQHRFDTELVAMTNTHHATMRELLIGRNLDWVRTNQMSLLDLTAG